MEIDKPSTITYTLSNVLIKPLPVFNHATEYHGIIHVSCIQGFLPGTFDLAGEEAHVQARQVCENLATVLAEAGSSLRDILKLTIYFTNMARDFAQVNEVINEYFSVNPPARSSIGVNELPRNCKVVMECVARKRDES